MMLAHFHHGEKNINKLKSPLHQMVNVLCCLCSLCVLLGKALQHKRKDSLNKGVSTFFTLRTNSGIYDSGFKFTHSSYLCFHRL